MSRSSPAQGFPIPHVARPPSWWHQPRVAGALTAAVIAAAVGSPPISTATFVYWPLVSDNLAFMAIAVLSAGLAGAAVVRVALRHAGRGLILMAFVTFCVAMLLAPFANGDPGAHPDLLPYVLLPGALAYVLLVTPVTAARIVAGACLWAVAFRAIAPHIVSEDELAQIRSDERARQRDKGRLIKLAVLAPIWFAVGWLMLQIRLGP